MVDEYPEIRDLEPPLDAKQLRAPDPGCKVVQFSSLPSDRDLKRLGAFLEEYPSVALRAYGGYDGSIRNAELG